LRDFGLYLCFFNPYTAAMRPEIERTAADIEQAIALLRRHL
jgi:hypothetical protein